MIHIERAATPKGLEKNGERWRKEYKEYLEKQGKYEYPRSWRSSETYNHETVKDALITMTGSEGKCFYSERLVKDEGDVEHFKEVSSGADTTEQAKLAFDWNNLYYADGKVNSTKAQFSDLEALDPCRDTDEEIEACISFDVSAGLVTSKNEKGKNTIKKYGLNSIAKLKEERKDIIIAYHQVHYAVSQQLRNNPEGLDEAVELEKLYRFGAPESPYSSIGKLLLKKYTPPSLK